MTDGVMFFAELNCRNTDPLLDRFRELVPSIADAVEIEEAGYRVRFACGEVKLRFSGEVLSVSVEADDLMMCGGIQAILAVIFFDHLSGPQPMVWQREQSS